MGQKLQQKYYIRKYALLPWFVRYLEYVNNDIFDINLITKETKIVKQGFLNFQFFSLEKIDEEEKQTTAVVQYSRIVFL